MNRKGYLVLFTCFSLILALVLIGAPTISIASPGSCGANCGESEVVQLAEGTVVVQERTVPSYSYSRRMREVTVHTYEAPDNHVTTHIIESRNSLVVVDAQQEEPFALEARAYADSLGKPIVRLIISHPHPDHFSGLPLAFNDVASFALEATVGAIAAQGVTVNNVLSPGDETIDGVRYEFVQVLDGESFEQLVIKLPDLGIVIVQDLAYNDLHLFLGSTTFDGWIAALQSLQLDSCYKTVLVGHGTPSDTSVYEENIVYLKTALKVIDMVDNGEAFQAEMIDRFLYMGGEGVFFYLGFVDWFAPPPEEG